MEQQLNAILENPDAMSRIMALAKHLSGKEPPIEEEKPISSDLGIDPQILTKFLPLLKDLNRCNSSSSQLLLALRPYLKEERQQKVERAIRLAHVIHITKQFLAEGGLDHV